ncbi:hypothetical protein AWJ14_14755 [Hoeflea olei]|uniref:Chromosomal replication initiator DnaA C-terminal domain-containing protein n=1 Tax=Hoeflea olei TaxID=1480615 RepID=A0A1C1YQA9_9HYPH|nr:hypothetical protein AWJ14_14755 [Hoeflea olei]
MPGGDVSLSAVSGDQDAPLAAIAEGLAVSGQAAAAAAAGVGAGAADDVRGRAGRRRGEIPAGRAHPVDVLRCRIVWRLVTELFAMAGERDLLPRLAARRRPCHTRQIAIYLSHVVLSVPYRTIAEAFARDRSTVMHACAVVEDRRDDGAYDRFVERCERCVAAVFQPFGGDHAER